MAEDNVAKYYMNSEHLLQSLAKTLKFKLGNRVDTYVASANDVSGIRITRKDKKMDLIPLADAIKRILKSKNIDVTDYELSYEGNNLLLAMNNIPIEEAKQYPFEEYKNKVKYDYIVEADIPISVTPKNNTIDFAPIKESFENVLFDEDFLHLYFDKLSIGSVYCDLIDLTDTNIKIKFGISTKDAEGNIDDNYIKKCITYYMKRLPFNIEAKYKIKQKGDVKITMNKEKKQESNSIALEDITLDILKNCEDCLEIEYMVACPECGAIFDEEENTYLTSESGVEAYSTFDEPYNERVKEYEVEKIQCPFCKHKDYVDEFRTADLDDLMDAPNREELVPGISKIEETDSCNDLDYNSLDKKLVTEGILIFEKTGSEKSIKLSDDGMMELHEDNKLYGSKPFSKLELQRTCKELIQNGYKLTESEVKVDDDTTIDTEKAKQEIEQATQDVEELQQMKDNLNDKVDKLVNESEDIEENKTDFPSTDYTQVALTSQDMEDFKLEGLLNEEQKQWIIKNVGPLDEVQEAIESLIDMVDFDGPVISIDDYINTIIN